MKINNNFNLFGCGVAKEIAESEKRSPSKNSKVDTLKYVLEEIKIGTRDSVTLACSTLESKNIEIPLLLKSLRNLFKQEVPHDATFDAAKKQLISEVVQNIETMVEDQKH